MPGITPNDPAERRRQAEAMVQQVRRKEPQVAQNHDRHVQRRRANPQLSYEDVDTSLIPPRPRLYGLVGAEEIEIVWKSREKK